MILKIIRENGLKIIYGKVKNWQKKDGKYIILQEGDTYREMIKEGDRLEVYSSKDLR